MAMFFSRGQLHTSCSSIVSTNFPVAGSAGWGCLGYRSRIATPPSYMTHAQLETGEVSV